MGSLMWPCLTLPACMPQRTRPWCGSGRRTSCSWPLWVTACLSHFGPWVQAVPVASWQPLTRHGW
uniref:Alternative protein MICAL2 n=1 Tax=Homo sapiens TaxID=9606 RepID=L8EAP5_HUMAN|nr:alternative protein MICAL2 [Homo sapiens]